MSAKIATKAALAVSAVRKEPDPLVALLVEYELLNANTENAISRIFAMLTVGAGALGLVISQVPTLADRTALKAIYVSLPLAFTLLFALVVQQMAAVVFAGYQLQKVEKTIGKMTGQRKIFQFNKLEAQALHSVRTGSKKHVLLYALIIVAIAAAYLGLLAYCVRGMINEDIPWPVVAIAIAMYVIANGIAFSALHGALFDARSIYEQVEKGVYHRGGSPKPVLRAVMYIFTPRFGDFFVKGSFFWIGVLAAIIVGQITGRVGGGGALVSNMGLIILSFLAVEWLTNQSKYMWNDVRDRRDDARLRLKKHRLLADYPTGPLPHVVALTFFVRASVGLASCTALALLFDIWVLPAAAVSLLGLQTAYELWGKRGLWRRLLVAVAGYPIRVAAGLVVTISALDIAWSDAWPLLVYLVLWTALFGLVFLSAFWRTEAEDARSSGEDPEEIREGLARFERADSLHAGSTLASVVVGPFAIAPLAMADGWRWPAILGIATGLPVALAVLFLYRRISADGEFRRRPLVRRVVPLLLPLTFVLACVAVVVSILDASETALVWSICFPAAAGSAAMFFYIASYQDLVVRISFAPLAVRLIRLYQSMFRFGPWAPEIDHRKQP